MIEPGVTPCVSVTLRLVGPLPKVTASRLKNFSLATSVPLSDQSRVVLTSHAGPPVPVQVRLFALPVTLRVMRSAAVSKFRVRLERVVPAGGVTSVGAVPVRSVLVSSTYVPGAGVEVGVSVEGPAKLAAPATTTLSLPAGLTRSKRRSPPFTVRLDKLSVPTGPSAAVLPIRRAVLGC